ncbi:MAG: CotH kinase family protein, partial [Candidatus Nealsonbacteria bacterium]|nr:CotH kinase family protein [Candidatus Nealsonbacteria bacterium]
MTTTVLRAAALKEDMRPSNIDTQTYIFAGHVVEQPVNPPGFPSVWGSATADYEMDPDVVDDPLYSDKIVGSLRTHPTISLVMEPDDWWSPATGIYANSLQAGLAWEREVSVELIDFPDGADFQVQSGIRMQGNASRNPSRPKHNMRLAFRSEYGPGKLEYPLFGDTDVQQFNDIVLRGGNGDSWFHPDAGRRPQAQYTHDQWHKATQVAMGQPTSQQTDAHLYINGLYWGFYHIIERPEWSYMEEHFGGQKEDYDVIQHKNGTVNGDRVAWDEMMQLVRTTNLSTDEAYADVLQYIDPANLADFMLLNFYSANTDWDHNNWYGARKRELGETWKFFSWDAEVTFRNFDANITGVSKTNQPTEVHQKLSVNAEYKMLFADRAHKHLFNGGPLTPEVVEADWMARGEEIELALIAESARWADHHRPSDPYTVEHEFRDRQNELRNVWFPGRTGKLIDQLKSRGMYPSLAAPSFNQHGGWVPDGFELTMAPTAGTIYYSLDGTDPRVVGGAVAQGALVYSPGMQIPLAQGTVVKARARSGATWSALNEAAFSIGQPATADNLVVTEINYNPAPPTTAELAIDDTWTNTAFEFIELRNVGPETINLAGAQFTAGIRYTFDVVVELDPGQYVVVAGNPLAFAARYDTTGILIADGNYTGVLDSNG